MAPQRTISLDVGWKIRRSVEVGARGPELSTPGYDDGSWLAARVPGTVLTALLGDREWLREHVPAEVLSLPRNRAGFDPFWHLNNQYLPDLGDRVPRGARFVKGRGRQFYTSWFRSEFASGCPLDDAERLWLQLRGINYTATVFLNGTQLPGTPCSGMFRRRLFDVTSMVRDGANALAIEVEPLQHPGIANGVNGSDGEIARNVSMQYAAGWDWVPPIADRNTGIWDVVVLRRTGPVRLQHPHVLSRVPGVRSPHGSQAAALLIISVETTNAGPEPQGGVLSLELEGVRLERRVLLQAGECRVVTFTPEDFPPLAIAEPRLWWPNGCGPQNLYHVRLAFETDAGRCSDEEMVRFGIREIRSDVPPGMGRVFYVNGRRVFIRGGNWVGTDALLRHTPQRYRDEVRLHRDMGLNMIRVWGGAIAERPEFYDACDEHGILVMQDFWITGDGNGAWPDASKRPQAERRRYPDDHELFLDCARDTIRMLRNHPSLCFWCGGNEIPPWGHADVETGPPPDLDGALAHYIGDHEGALDPTRIYVPGSADAEYVGFDGGGLHGHGPYGYQEPEFYCGLARGFTTEIGTASLPPAESMREMIAEGELFVEGKPGWGRPGWRYHNEQNADTYGFAIEQYGRSRDLEDFCLKAQLVNYKSHQGIFEAWNGRMWSSCSGLLLWKTQNCWPNLRSQVYDWYLEPNAGFYATRRACAPVSVQLDQASWRVGVCNTTAMPLERHVVEATLCNLDGYAVQTIRCPAGVPPDTYAPVLRLRHRRGLSAVFFVRLVLRDASGTRVADNVYWFSRRGATSRTRYAALQELRDTGPVSLHASVRRRRTGEGWEVCADLHNRTPGIAFFVRLKLRRADGATRVLPAFFSDNYLTLFPGEQQRVVAECSHAAAGGSAPRLLVEGWNVALAEIA